MIKRYAELDGGAAEVVDLVMMEFSDLFDNDAFGPFIQDFTDFGKDRYAALLELAIGDVLILVSIAGVSWDVESYPYHLPSAKRCAVLALTIEVIRHLVRSYVEIPDTARVGAPDVVRRDYLSRWQGLLNDYQQQLKDAAKQLEIDVYDENYRRYTKVLVDLPSMRGVMNLDQPAERPTIGWWW